MAREKLKVGGSWQEMARRANFRSAALATLLGVSRRQLHRYTHKLFQLSPQAWLDDCRLALAKGLLLRERSVKVVSYELGFKQVSHFSREFKRRHGLSPRQFMLSNEGVRALVPHG